MSIESEYEVLRHALELPTVGHPTRAEELAELRRLVGKYAVEARALTADPGQDT